MARLVTQIGTDPMGRPRILIYRNSPEAGGKIIVRFDGGCLVLDDSRALQLADALRDWATGNVGPDTL